MSVWTCCSTSSTVNVLQYEQHHAARVSVCWTTPLSNQNSAARAAWRGRSYSNRHFIVILEMLYMVCRYSSSEKTRVFCLFVCFLSHFYFFSLWTSCGLRCRPFSPPPGTCLQFLSCIGFSIPIPRRLPSNVANSRFRAFRESICAQEKVPTNLNEYYALGGTRTHAIDL